MSEKPGGKDEKEQVDTVSVCVYLFFFAELRAQRKIETNSQISSVTTTTPASFISKSPKWRAPEESQMTINLIHHVLARKERARSSR